MNYKRIIPCLDVNHGRVVKGVNFVNLVDAGDPAKLPLFIMKPWPMSWFFRYYCYNRGQRYYD